MKANPSILEQCRNYISNGDTDKAIQILLDQIGKTDKNLILVSSRWKTLQKNKIGGVISGDDYLTNKGVIDDSILTILDIIESEESHEKSKISRSITANRQSNTIWIATTIIALILVFSVVSCQLSVS
ncbi:MAG: hypothetical protein JNK77_16485 [Saprospiraceae bacterium]|nr:hypothetical protein [Saprospiraceae bacterium]